ncbi:MAG TPA: polysaccharide deacetylase family protein [Roseomonas sp.]|nr:polysaccharide deacetylase family protein [Roseomonas sp.]
MLRTLAKGAPMGMPRFRLPSAQWRPVLRRQPHGVTDVALTFDDGPSPITTVTVLEMLARADAKATFFLTGTRVQAYPELVRAIIAEGHAVYGHGWEHVHLEAAGPAAALEAMQRVEALLAQFRPTPSLYLIRLPYNDGFRRAWMHKAMARFHPNACFAWWTISPQDYRLADGCATLEQLEARCKALGERMRKIRRLPGSIVLLHEDPFGGPGALAPRVSELVLPHVLSAVAARGARCGLVQTEASAMRNRWFFAPLRGEQTI